MEEEAQLMLTVPITEVTISTLKKVKMPRPVKTVGRPKGSDKTVIGTKKVVKKKSSSVKFVQMRQSEKEKYVLSLCIGLEATYLVLKQGHKVSVNQIDPTEIRGAVFNSSVCLQQIRYVYRRGLGKVPILSCK